MTSLITRNEIFKAKKIITSEISKMQKAFYDEEIFQLYKDDNEEDLYNEMYDCLNTEEIEYKTFNKILSLNHSEIETFCVTLTEQLIELFKTINATEFYIISHLKLDYFGNRKNKFKPLINAYKKLEIIVKQSTYKEAFIIDLNELQDFIEILFWTTRCDPSIAEYIFLFDKNERIQINLCKYGNIHLTEFIEEQLTNEKLIQLGWTIIEGQEHDNFTVKGKIEGRQLKI